MTPLPKGYARLCLRQTLRKNGKTDEPRLTGGAKKSIMRGPQEMKEKRLAGDVGQRSYGEKFYQWFHPDYRVLK